MARSHWIIGACPALLAVIVAACGGGDEAADTNNGTQDAGSTPAPVDAGSGTVPEAAPPPVTDAPLDPDAAGEVSETSINFGSVNCGATAAPRTFAINNPSTKGSLRFEAILGKGDGSPFTISPASGTIQPGQRQIVTLTPYTIPRGSVENPTSTVANGQGDIVTVVAGTANLSVDVLQRANGAILTFGSTGIDFKSSPIAQTAAPITQTYGIQNAGSVPATLKMTVGGGGPFGLGDSVATKTATIAAGIGNASGTAIFRPTTAATFNGTVAMELTDDVPLCADLPEALTLRGRGVDSTVQLSQGQLDFGFTPCGNTALPKTITLTNLGNQPIKVTSLSVSTGGTYYGVAVSPGVNTQIAPNATATITVTPRTITPGATLSFDPNTYKGVVTLITRDDVNNVDVTQQVDLLQTMQGAFLTRTPAGLAFGQQPKGSVTSLAQTFANTGNQDVVLNLSKQNGLTQFTLDRNQVSLAKNGGAAPLNVQFTPNADAAITELVNIVKDAATAGVPWCHQSSVNANATPTTITGSGRNPTIAANPGSLDFLAVNCGSTTDAKTITFTNNGPAGRYKAAMRVGAQYALSGAPLEADIPSFGTVTFTVTPLAVPTTNANLNAITDNVTFTLLDGPGGNQISTLSPGVSITPKGALIQWFRDDNKSGITTAGLGTIKTNTGTGTFIADFRNGGTVNTTASFELGFKDPSSAMFTVNKTAFPDVAQNTFAPFTITFKPVAAGAATAGAQTGTLFVQSLNPAVPVCNTQATLAVTGSGN